MSRRTGGRANLFLVELVLNLLIFALCAAVCLGLLARARGMSRESADLTLAVAAAQTAAEEWRLGQTGGDSWCPAALFRGGSVAAGKFLRADGSPIPASQAALRDDADGVAYTLTMNEARVDGLRTAWISVRAGYLGGEIYALTVTAPEEVTAP